MSDALSFAELDGQHVELLATRTVLSMFVHGITGGRGNRTNSFSVNTILSFLQGNSYGTNGADATGA